MHARRRDQTHRPIDARTRIPPRMVVTRIRADRQGVHALLDERRGIHAETHIAVVPTARQDSVHIDLRTRHHAVELEPERAAGPNAVHLLLGQLEVAAVPAHAPPGQLARTARRVRVERPRDGPVVRQVEPTPSGVVIVGACRQRVVAQAEAPVIREELTALLGCLRAGAGGKGQQQK